MPRFFFNLSSQGNVSIDETGTDFSSLEAAYLETCGAILEMAIEKLREREDPGKDMFEITDERGNVLMQVPFSEVLRPQGAAKSNVKPEMMVTLNNCLHQVTQCEALQADIREGFEQVKNTFSDIHATLARIA